MTLSVSENGGNLSIIDFSLVNYYTLFRHVAGRRCSAVVSRQALSSLRERDLKTEQSQQYARKAAARISREVIIFWRKIEKVTYPSAQIKMFSNQHHSLCT